MTKSGDPAVAQIGDSVVFTLFVSNNGILDADNVVVTDVIPAFLDIDSVVVAPAGPSITIISNTITIDFGTVTPSDTYTVTISTTINSSATPPGGVNDVTLTTTSPDSDPTNNVDSAPILIVGPGDEIPDTGFAPGRVTHLPAQPADKAHLTYAELWLEMPTIGVEAEILGVPLTEDGWDVTWLYDQAGYLVGTAFPTWVGNSVITAHVGLPDGLPGPFADLGLLRFGDQVIVHAWGLRHIYEVRSVKVVAGDDRSVFHHEEQSWLTLVTCFGFDEARDTYRWRVVARAVLVAIEDDDSANESRGVARGERRESTDLRSTSLQSAR